MAKMGIVSVTMASGRRVSIFHIWVLSVWEMLRGSVRFLQVLIILRCGLSPIRTATDYGYILTGELNTAEYELVAQDGTDGESIKGDPGIQGCIIRKGEWKIGVEWRNDESLTSGTRYLDVALVRDGQVATGWKAYKCKTTHTSSLANAPGNSTYWEEFGLNTTAIFTSLIIAKDAQIDFMQGNQLLIKKDDGTVTAGLSGTQSGEKIRMWAGSPTPDDAPFRESTC